MSIPSGMGHAGIVAVPIPAGGAANEVLAKQSTSDYDYAWVPVAGSSGEVTRAEMDALMYFLGE